MCRVPRSTWFGSVRLNTRGENSSFKIYSVSITLGSLFVDGPHGTHFRKITKYSLRRSALFPRVNRKCCYCVEEEGVNCVCREWRRTSSILTESTNGVCLVNIKRADLH